MSYSVAVCDDIDYVKSVMLDPEMWERSSNDNTRGRIEDIPCIWLCAYLGDKRVGLCSVLGQGGTAVEIHIHIPKRYRGSGTLEMGKLFLNWIKDNSVGGINKINTQVPEIYKDVIMFASKLGFSKEGVNRLSISKNGKIMDMVYMGITFDEVGR